MVWVQWTLLDVYLSIQTIDYIGEKTKKTKIKKGGKELSQTMDIILDNQKALQKPKIFLRSRNVQNHKVIYYLKPKKEHIFVDLMPMPRPQVLIGKSDYIQGQISEKR